MMRMEFLIAMLFSLIGAGVAHADIASKGYVVEQTSTQVKTTGNQEISGTKTYTASPVVPTPALPTAE